MNRDFAERWVGALRSGEYQQCSRRLHNGRGYCCLGVAEILSGSEFASDDQGTYFIDGKSESDYLTEETMQAIGVGYYNGSIECGKDPILVGGKFYVCLSDANDDGRTFAEIADAIEANWERL